MEQISKPNQLGPGSGQNATEPTKFVIFCKPRTGSYHLMSLLDSAPDIVCHGELFKGPRVELRPSHKEKLGQRGPRWRDAHPWAFINRIQALDPKQHFGFKLFQDHAKRVDCLDAILRRDSWKKIALYHDPIEVYASLLRAKETQRWTQRKDAKPDDRSPAVKVHFTPDSYEGFARNYGRFLKIIARFAGQPEWFVVHYNQLNDPATRQALLTFLGSTACADELTSEYAKQYDLPVSDAFDNWGELCGFVASDEATRNLMAAISRIAESNACPTSRGHDLVAGATH